MIQMVTGNKNNVARFSLPPYIAFNDIKSTIVANIHIQIVFAVPRFFQTQAGGKSCNSLLSSIQSMLSCISSSISSEML